MGTRVYLTCSLDNLALIEFLLRLDTYICVDNVKKLSRLSTSELRPRTTWIHRWCAFKKKSIFDADNFGCVDRRP